MSANTPKAPEKISADCPHCGFSQLESAYAKSTFCRKCGEHFNIEKLLMKETTSLKGPSIFDKFSKMMSREKIRDVACFSCGARQQVSSEAHSSSCPQCGSYIDLRDFKIAGPFGRSIQTQGEVVITPKGDIASARIACGSAMVEGRLKGTLFCTGIARFRMNGKFLGGVDVHRLVVEKKSDFEFVQPVKVRGAEINGKVSARILCDGCVTVTKGGILEGTVYARAVNFEQGGIFSGDLYIGQIEAEQPDLIPPAASSTPQTGLFGQPELQVRHA